MQSNTVEVDRRISAKKELRRKSHKESVSSFLSGSILLLLILIIWQIAGSSWSIGSLFTSSPTKIIKKAIELFSAPAIYGHIASSLSLFFSGYILSAVVGIPLGILLGWFKRFNKVVSPVLTVFYIIPRIALMPLFIMWFGLRFKSKLILVFLSAVFNLAFNMQTAIESLDADLTKTALAYGANRLQLFFTVALPQSVPYLMTALRLAAGRAFAGVVSAEVFGDAHGIGYMIQYAGATFSVDTLFVGVVLLALFGLALDRTLLALSHRFDKWRPSGEA